MTWPDFCFRMCGNVALIILTGPKKLVSNWLRTRFNACCEAASSSTVPIMAASPRKKKKKKDVRPETSARVKPKVFHRAHTLACAAKENIYLAKCRDSFRNSCLTFAYYPIYVKDNYQLPQTRLGAT